MRNRVINKRKDIVRFSFYIYVGITYLIFRVIIDTIVYPEAFFISILDTTWLCIYIIPLNFLFFRYCVPQFRIGWLSILLSIIIIFFALIIYTYGMYVWKLLGTELHIIIPLDPDLSFEEQTQGDMAYCSMSVFYFAIGKHIYNHQNLRITAQKLRIEKQEAELNYLRSQTNPHFLFNTLNNIYSLSRIGSNLAPESILKLSKILRFMLYETNEEYVTLEKEITIIEDYIALEQLRYDESLTIDFSYDIEDVKETLSPLLLIPLVENAFKYGVSETRSKPFVEIYLEVKDRKLSLSVKNSMEVYGVQNTTKESIGIVNLRRQLELLYTDFELNFEHEDSVFLATLIINLESHV